LNVDAVLEDGIPVFKRICGGGAVLLSPGCVCMALRFAKSKTLGIHDYFAKAAALITEVAAERLGIRIGLRGISDLAYLGPLEGARPLNGGSTGSELPLLMRAGERKIAGSSLYMPRDFVLYLVSILVDPDFSAIDKYLSHPSKEPDYRGGRSHKDFLAGLGPLSGAALRPADFAQWLRQGLQQKIPETPGLDLDWELSGGKPPGVG
jgi:lipoate-protein ligase A